MNISQLPYFISIAENCSLVAAAKEFGITKQALSKYITRITQEYGVEFFEKNHGKIVLTQAGRCFYEHARDIMNIYDKMLSAVSARNDDHTLHVGVTRNIGITTISGIIPEFTSRFPTAFLAITEGYVTDLINGVINGIHDLALSSDVDPLSEDCEVIPLFNCEIYVAIPVQHPYLLAHPRLKAEDRIDIDDLREYEFCLSMNRLSFPYKIADKILGGNFRNLGRIRESSSTRIIETNIATGLGIGFLPQTSHPDKIRLFSLSEPFYVYHSLYYKKGKHLSDEAKYLVELYKKSILQNEYSGWNPVD